jgi:hypothetical protein
MTDVEGRRDGFYWARVRVTATKSRWEPVEVLDDGLRVDVLGLPRMYMEDARDILEWGPEIPQYTKGG